MGCVESALIPAVISSDSAVARVRALKVLWNLNLFFGNINSFVSCGGISATLAALESSSINSESFKGALTV